MRGQHTVGGRSVDGDGVTRVEQPRAGVGSWLLGLAVVFTVGCIALSVWLASSPGATEEPQPEVRAPPPSTSAVTPSPSAPVRVVKRPSAPPVVEPAVAPPPEEEPDPEDSLPTMDPPTGEKTGLALFVPGTKPIKKGIVVPEGFELPPGYMRHYQTTDDGQMLEPILMFHPDYQPADANGQPQVLPENRVVPAEMAPSGMPIKLLDVPERKPEPGR